MPPGNPAAAAKGGFTNACGDIGIGATGGIPSIIGEAIDMGIDRAIGGARAAIGIARAADAMGKVF